MNGATCVDTHGSYTCICTAEFWGKDCDQGNTWFEFVSTTMYIPYGQCVYILQFKHYLQDETLPSIQSKAMLQSEYGRQ